MKGRLIVLEGLDGSGKSTQLALLKERLSGDVRFVKFPVYDSPAGQLIKQYLSGAFGARPGDVNAYAASAFYAVDRFASYKSDWGAAYEAGATVLCDRYATSNAVHQAAKLEGAERDAYLDWLTDFEYGKLGIPKPDAVIFLDMPVAVSQRLISARYQGDEGQKDIHERDVAYLEHCRQAALYAAKRLGWSVVTCAEGDVPRTREAIAADVYAAVLAAEK
ncbi:MAG: thymidylate kinase [Clostridia bacterium]|nr:thymidylate kinase [Clostridia bacterium]